MTGEEEEEEEEEQGAAARGKSHLRPHMTGEDNYFIAPAAAAYLKASVAKVNLGCCNFVASTTVVAVAAPVAADLTAFAPAVV